MRARPPPDPPWVGRRSDPWLLASAAGDSSYLGSRVWLSSWVGLLCLPGGKGAAGEGKGFWKGEFAA
uniref:Uncharacterized protein n=1 Tax=Arundo donax TaxID=35708 RepID=A0A0A8XMW4_ARUDO